MTLELALNPFEGKKTGRKAEREEKIELELDEKVERVLEQHRQLNSIKDYYKTEKTLKNLEYEALNPTQIDIILQRIMKKLEEEHWPIADFLSKIIQKSYDAGYNNFTLTTKKTQIDFLASELKGKQENPLQITIQGNTGDLCGEELYECTFNIQGNTGYELGAKSENCTYNITGNTQRRCGIFSTNCKYNIAGNTEELCGQSSENCTYNITGNTGDRCGHTSENCTFTTPNEKTYKKILKDVKNYAMRFKVKYTGE